MTSQSRSKNRGLRAALEKKKTRRSHYDIPQVEHTDAVAAKSKVNECSATLKAAQFLLARSPGNKEVEQGVAEAQRALDQAQKALDACFYRQWFIGLKESDFDALVNAHPPTDEQRAKAKVRGEEEPLWNDETFVYELLEHCALDSDLTAEEWREELNSERWTGADKRELIGKVLEANIRSFNASLNFE